MLGKLDMLENDGDWSIGDKVWYHTWSGERLSAVITDIGEKNDQPVYDVEVAGARVGERLRWAYANQLTVRS